MIRRWVGLVSGDHHDHIATLKAVQDQRNQPKPLSESEILEALR